MQKPQRATIAMSGFLLLGVFALVPGCGKALMYPMEVEGPQPVAVDDFGDLDLTADTFKGRAILMAGRIIGTDTQDGNVLITAEWLPIPKDMRNGPSEAEASPDRRFVVHYPAGIDSAGLWSGNKFVAVGRMHDAGPGGAPAFLDVDAFCLHIWKTRGLSIAGVLEDERGRFAVPEQTYCHKVLMR